MWEKKLQQVEEWQGRRWLLLVKVGVGVKAFNIISQRRWGRSWVEIYDGRVGGEGRASKIQPFFVVIPINSLGMIIE